MSLPTGNRKPNPQHSSEATAEHTCYVNVAVHSRHPSQQESDYSKPFVLVKSLSEEQEVAIQPTKVSTKYRQSVTAIEQMDEM